MNGSFVQQQQQHQGVRGGGEWVVRNRVDSMVSANCVFVCVLSATKISLGVHKILPNTECFNRKIRINKVEFRKKKLLNIMF